MAGSVYTEEVDCFHTGTPAWNNLVRLEADLEDMMAQVNLAAQASDASVTVFPIVEMLRPRLAQAWEAAQAEEQADLAGCWGSYPALLTGPNPWA